MITLILLLLITSRPNFNNRKRLNIVYILHYIVTTLRQAEFWIWTKKMKTDSFDLFHYNTKAWSYLQITCNKLIPVIFRTLSLR